jgi:hypothetical protein
LGGGEESWEERNMTLVPVPTELTAWIGNALNKMVGPAGDEFYSFYRHGKKRTGKASADRRKADRRWPMRKALGRTEEKGGLASRDASNKVRSLISLIQDNPPTVRANGDGARAGSAASVVAFRLATHP